MKFQFFPGNLFLRRVTCSRIAREIWAFSSFTHGLKLPTREAGLGLLVIKPIPRPLSPQAQ